MSGVIFMSEDENTDITNVPRNVDNDENTNITDAPRNVDNDENTDITDVPRNVDNDENTDITDAPRNVDNDENTDITVASRNIDNAEPMPLAESLDSQKLNPLLCFLCNKQYREPCILQCFHSYCVTCLATKIHDGQVSCPLCGVVTIIKEGSVGPAPDQLLQFLVESSSSDRVQCANCDAIESQMYFCNTCSQPLCLACREETHRPRMFALHEIVLLSKRTREIQRQCKIHGEPYILFSTEKKRMLCINCFRDMKVESRSHCVDMETAYKQGCQKLDNTMQSIRDLQHSVRDAILLLKALLEEIEKNAEREKIDISELFDTMQDKITETKKSLLKEIESQYEEKRKLFKDQLVSLSTFLPTLHVHLVTCAAFSSSANRFEFLDLTYVLMERLKSIIQVQYPLHPSQGSELVTDYKGKFAKCLEPLLFPHRNNNNINVPASKASSMSTPRLDSAPMVTASVSNLLCSGGSVIYTQAHVGGRRYSHNMAKVKLIDDTGYFAEHCKEFDDAHRELMQKVEKIKLGVQELQRDLTLRRCLAKDTAMGELTTRISATEDLLDGHLGSVEQTQPGLENHWQKCLEKIAGEQDIYKAQLQDVARLKSETQSVKTILQRLSSFVSSIASVTERIAPKLASHGHENPHAALLHDIITVTPDSQQRVDAIIAAQEVREEKAASRTNPMDEELIKTKGLLRAPSARKDSARRESREIKDPVSEEEGDSKKRVSESDGDAEVCDKEPKSNQDALEVTNVNVGSKSEENTIQDSNTNESKSKQDAIEDNNESIEGKSKQDTLINDENVTIENQLKQDTFEDKDVNIESISKQNSLKDKNVSIEGKSKTDQPKDKNTLEEKTEVLDNSIKSDEEVKDVKDIEINGAINEHSVLNKKAIVKVFENNTSSGIDTLTNPSSDNQSEENCANETAGVLCTADKKTNTVPPDINTKLSDLNTQSSVPITHPSLPDVTINAFNKNTNNIVSNTTAETDGNSEDELSAEFTIKLELTDSNDGTEVSLDSKETHLDPDTGKHNDGRDSQMCHHPENDNKNEVVSNLDNNESDMKESDDVIKCDQTGVKDMTHIANKNANDNLVLQQNELKSKSIESDDVARNLTETAEQNSESSAIGIDHSKSCAIEKDVDNKIPDNSENDSINNLPNGTSISPAKAKEIDSKEQTTNDTDHNRMNEFVLFSNDDNNPIKRLKPVDKVKEKPEAKCNSEEEDEEYVTKSLPELAQVFQPGELIKKKQRTKSDSSKSPQDPAK